jgi:hypothetical protein
MSGTTQQTFALGMEGASTEGSFALCWSFKPAGDFRPEEYAVAIDTAITISSPDG